MAAKLCDSCKSAAATLFCRADSAFLCASCDGKVHAANKLASRHGRVWLCDVCEHHPAFVTCKADEAALCVTCDRDIHSANPLSRRHERVPVTPFYDPVDITNSSSSAGRPDSAPAVNFLDDRCFSEADANANAETEAVSREEAEAASWLLPNPKAMDLNSGGYVYPGMDPFLDLDYGSVDPKIEEGQEQTSCGTDGVVPQQSKTLPPFEIDFSAAASSKPFVFGYAAAQCLSQSVSSSSMDVSVVPDGNAMTEVSDPYNNNSNKSIAMESPHQAVQLSSADREARVMRYREKRKSRKFEKTIRYASRKAYAETRPRIKGRFAKRTEVEIEAERLSRYGVVPSF